jgi:hypothetical protein
VLLLLLMQLAGRSGASEVSSSSSSSSSSPAASLARPTLTLLQPEAGEGRGKGQTGKAPELLLLQLLLLQ